MSRLAAAVAVGREVLARVSDARLTFLAAAIAYYAFVSVLPLLLFGLVVASLVGGEALAAAVISAMGTLLTPAGEAVVRDALARVSDAAGVTVVGLGLLLWSGLRVFRGLDAAFSQVYGVRGAGSLLEQVRDGLSVVATIGLAAVAAVVLGGVLPWFDWLPYSDLLAAVALPAALFVVFLPMFYLFPDVEMTPRDAAPGAAVAAVGWTALTAVFGVYVSLSSTSLYGVLGGALLLVTWFYLAAIVIMAGAVLNAVLASGHGPDGDDEEAGTGDDAPTDPDDRPAPDIVAMERELEALRERLEERTVDRSELEGDLRQYVRRRLRRGHARGWGPYLVLLYGTAMTVGAFYFLAGAWAVLAMGVVWLSTLGLYVLMVLVGVGLSAASVPGRLLDRLRSWRS